MSRKDDQYMHEIKRLEGERDSLQKQLAVSEAKVTDLEDKNEKARYRAGHYLERALIAERKRKKPKKVNHVRHETHNDPPHLEPDVQRGSDGPGDSGDETPVQDGDEATETDVDGG